MIYSESDLRSFMLSAWPGRFYLPFDASPCREALCDAFESIVQDNGQVGQLRSIVRRVVRVDRGTGTTSLFLGGIAWLFLAQRFKSIWYLSASRGAAGMAADCFAVMLEVTGREFTQSPAPCPAIRISESIARFDGIRGSHIGLERPELIVIDEPLDEISKSSEAKTRTVLCEINAIPRMGSIRHPTSIILATTDNSLRPIWEAE